MEKILGRYGTEQVWTDSNTHLEGDEIMATEMWKAGKDVYDVMTKLVTDYHPELVMVLDEIALSAASTNAGLWDTNKMSMPSRLHSRDRKRLML